MSKTRHRTFAKARSIEEKLDATRRIMRKMKRPYGLGFNGHARKCDCSQCARARVDAVKQYVKAPKVALPKTADSTVLVRAHFRRQPRHLKRMPETRSMLRAWLAEWDGRTR